MKKAFAMLFAAGLALAGSSAFAGETATFLSRCRSKSSTVVTPGVWHRNFSAAKKWAVANGVPFVAVWSNGDKCGHCVQFEKCLNASSFIKWEKQSGIVFFFGYSGDSEYKVAGSVFEWIRGGKNTSYPFVRVYWPKGKVDIATVGDVVDGYSAGKATASTAIKFFKTKLAKFVPYDPKTPYTINYTANMPEDYTPSAGDCTNDVPVSVLYETTVKATNVFETAGYTLIGWSAAAGVGTVKYAVGASLQGLTTKSNAVVNIYGQWAHENYEVKFDCNYVPGALDGQSVTNMDSAVFKYGTSMYLPTNVITRADYAFAGWSTTPTGSVVYKDNAAVKNLTRNASVTLYARWTRITYRTYYTGLKYTIATGLKGRSITTKIPGMTWYSSTGKFVGKPTTAKTYKIGFKKSGATIVYRYFVVVKDAISIPAIEGKTLETDTSTVSDIDVAALSGALVSSTVSGLPEGMEYDPATGKITGRPKYTGTYTVKVTGKTKNSQTVTATYTFEVGEGDTILISGLAHFDEFWAEDGKEFELPLRLRVRTNEVFTIVKPTEGVEVVLRLPGATDPVGAGYGEMYYDDATASLVGQITGAASEYEADISTEVYVDGEESAREITWTFPIKVYFSEDPQ